MLPWSPIETQVRRQTTMDIYRVGTVPPAAPAQSVPVVFIESDFWRRGEAGEGDVAVGHFSHTVLIPADSTDPFVDIRDDYNAGTRGANFDTVYIPDQNGTGLVVRFVERVLLSDGENVYPYKRVYLDRKIPDWAGSGLSV